MRNLFLIVAVLILGAAGDAWGQSAGNSALPAAEDEAVRKNIEAYLRNLYAWGADAKLAVGPLKESGAAGLLETTAEVTLGDQKDSARIFVSRDGKFMFRGEMSDLSKDPLAETRAKIQLEGAPAKGDPKAPITIVEFADFECPTCRQLHEVLRSTLPNYPQVRLIFKDFPLSTIHPWARTASIAGRCAYYQDPNAFWTLYDRIYDDQELISASNAWSKMIDYAAQAKLDPDAFKGCMASAGAAKAVDDSFANGQALEVSSTPTLFVNGRRMVGADRNLLEQYFKYELAQKKATTVATKP